MAIYANIYNGVVGYLYETDSDIYSLFHKDIVWVDVTDHPEVGQDWLYDEDTKTFSAPPVIQRGPTPEQILKNTLSDGVEIDFADAADLSGVYAINDVDQMRMSTIETGLLLGRGFPGGAASYSYPLKSGELKSFNKDQFIALSAAVRDYSFALTSYVNGFSKKKPSQPVTIPAAVAASATTTATSTTTTTAGTIATTTTSATTTPEATTSSATVTQSTAKKTGK